MKNFQNIMIAAGLLSITLSVSAEDKGERSVEMVEVTPSSHMISGIGGFTGGNIGLLVDEDGVTILDESMPPLLDKMNVAIKSITDKPVDFLIKTPISMPIILVIISI